MQQSIAVTVPEWSFPSCKLAEERSQMLLQVFVGEIMPAGTTTFSPEIPLKKRKGYKKKNKS